MMIREKKPNEFQERTASSLNVREGGKEMGLGNSEPLRIRLGLKGKRGRTVARR